MMIRDVGPGHHWELQCPVCRQFVTINADEIEGVAPFPTHRRWAASWLYDVQARWPRVGASRRFIRTFLWLEGMVRDHVWREPVCGYDATFNWRSLMPPSGISSFGPLRQ